MGNDVQRFRSHEDVFEDVDAPADDFGFLLQARQILVLACDALFMRGAGERLEHVVFEHLFDGEMLLIARQFQRVHQRAVVDQDHRRIGPVAGVEEHREEQIHRVDILTVLVVLDARSDAERKERLADELFDFLGGVSVQWLLATAFLNRDHLRGGEIHVADQARPRRVALFRRVVSPGSRIGRGGRSRSGRSRAIVRQRGFAFRGADGTHRVRKQTQPRQQ